MIHLLLVACQEKLRLLRAWVNSGGNKAACESAIVLQKEKSERFEGHREPWSIRDMLLANWPVEKIRSIVSRGGASPDPDCPEVQECYQYWVIVQRRRSNTESVTQTASTRINTQTTSDGLAAVLGTPANLMPSVSGAAVSGAAGAAGGAAPVDLVGRVQQSLSASTGGEKVAKVPGRCSFKLQC